MKNKRILIALVSILFISISFLIVINYPKFRKKIENYSSNIDNKNKSSIVFDGGTEIFNVSKMTLANTGLDYYNFGNSSVHPQYNEEYPHKGSIFKLNTSSGNNVYYGVITNDKNGRLSILYGIKSNVYAHASTVEAYNENYGYYGYFTLNTLNYKSISLDQFLSLNIIDKNGNLIQTDDYFTNRAVVKNFNNYNTFTLTNAYFDKTACQEQIYMEYFGQSTLPELHYVGDNYGGNPIIPAAIQRFNSCTSRVYGDYDYTTQVQVPTLGYTSIKSTDLYDKGIYQKDATVSYLINSGSTIDGFGWGVTQNMGSPYNFSVHPNVLAYGYNVSGFYNTPDFREQIPSNDGFGKYLVIYPRLVPITYSISYDLKGAQYATYSDPYKNAPQLSGNFSSYTVNDVVNGLRTLPDIVTRRGYNVDKIYIEYNNSAYGNNTKTFYKGDVMFGTDPSYLGNLVVHYTYTPITYNVYLNNLYSYNSSTRKFTQTNNSLYKSYTVENTFGITDPTRHGYTFTGWTGSNGNTPQKNYTVPGNTVGNLSYTANWTPTNYTISYNLNGGQANLKTSYNIEGGDFTLPTPTRPGYTFTGWTGSGLNSAQTTVNVRCDSAANLSYTANWRANTYPISYNLNSGSISGQKTSYTPDDANFTLPTPTRTGFDFVGWTGSNGNTPQKTVTITKGTYGDKSYTANWTYTNYTISYTLNGGKIQNQPTSYTMASPTITLPTPTNNGYEFLGWTGSNGYTIQLNVSIPTGSTGNKTYTANWRANDYFITYNLNGGSMSDGVKRYTVETESFTLPTPTKKGYTFTGWTGTEQDTPNKNTVVQKGSVGDRTYNANWELTRYPITYNLNGGKLDNKLEYYTYADANVKIPIPVNDGYTFMGWTGSNGNTPQINVTFSNEIGNKTYTANWETIDYTIKYKLNGGTMSDGLKEYTVLSSNYTLPTPTKLGYTFTGWTDGSGSAPNKNYVLTKGSYGNKEFTANWQITEYPITYNLNGGYLNNQPNKYTIDDQNVRIPSPEKLGYTFTGWTGSNGDKPQIRVYFSNETGNKNYVANWKATEYSITYNLDGGNVKNEINSYTIESDTITLPTPTKLGYTFTGWTGSDLNDKTMSVSIAKGSTGNKSYTANWFKQAVNDRKKIIEIEVSTVSTSVDDFVKSNNNNVTVKSPKGEVKEPSAKIGTGDVVINTDNTQYHIVVYGDINGDGKVSSVDYVRAWNHLDRKSSNKVTDKYQLLALDVNGDGKVSTADCVNIWNKIKR